MEGLTQLGRGMVRGFGFLVLWMVLCAIVTNLTGPDGASLAVVTATGCTVGAWHFTRRSKKASAVVCQGIEINRSRVEDILRRYRPTISLGQRTVTAPLVTKAMSRPEPMNALQDFQAHYMHDLIDEIADGRLDWNNENCELFFELMRQRHKLTSGVIIASLLYIMEERIFTIYRDSLGHLRGASLAAFARETALSDVCCDAPFDGIVITRFARECGINAARKKLERHYWKARRSLQLSKFEENLGTPLSTTASVTEQIRTEAQRALIESAISDHLDTDTDSYIMVGPDYSRDSRIDTYYRKHFSYVLSRAFDGHCCSCGEGMGALQFDHFWCPKSSGGNFLMRSRDGAYVNNCIPLCGSCNASKGKKDFRDFFDQELVETIVQRSQSINAFINEHMTTFLDPEFVGRVTDDVGSLNETRSPADPRLLEPETALMGTTRR